MISTTLKQKIKLSIYSTSLIIFSAFSAFAQPSNDDCINAIELTPTSYCQYTNFSTLNATESQPACTGTANDDVWFKFIATSTTYKISVVGSSSFGPVLETFEGDCSTLNSLGCVDDNFGYGSSEQTTLTSLNIGDTYYIRVHDNYGFASSDPTFDICVSELAVLPTSNSNTTVAADSCEYSPMLCDINGYTANTKVYDAINEPDGYTVTNWTELDDEFCGSVDNNSFSTFIPIASTINFNVWVYNSQYNNGIQIAIMSIPNCYGGPVTSHECFNQLLPLGTNDYHSITVPGLTPGNTYYIVVDGYAGDDCEYTIGLPPNSGFATNTSITPLSETICLGNSIDLIASGGDGTYNWDANSDLNTTSGNIVSATPTSSGTKTYTVNSTTTNPQCPSINSATATIEVVSSPSISLVDTALCSSSISSITLRPIVSVPGGNFTWNDASTLDSLVVSGSGTYTVDYSITGCPIANAQSVVTLASEPVINYTSNVSEGCSPLTININNTTTNTTNYNWIVSDGQTSNLESPTFTFTNDTLYTFKLIASNVGCIDSLTKTNLVEVFSQPIASFSPNANSVSSNNSNITFYNNSSNSNNFIWNFGEGFPSDTTTSLSDTTYNYSGEEGYYTVKLIAQNDNCSDSTESTIRIFEELIYYIPNSFTPNKSDANNDLFTPIFTSGYEPSSYNFKIFDRWGNIVFETSNSIVGWNGEYKGKQSPPGGYTWRINFTETKTDKNHTITGNVNLLR